MSKSSRPVDIKYSVIVHETDSAYLLRMIGGKEVWLPKSQVEIDEGDDIVTMPEWLAIEKEIDDDAE